MGISFSSSCVLISYIVFSFSFCLLQAFVIPRDYLIEKKMFLRIVYMCLDHWCKRGKVMDLRLSLVELQLRFIGLFTFHFQSLRIVSPPPPPPLEVRYERVFCNPTYTIMIQFFNEYIMVNCVKTLLWSNWVWISLVHYL